MWKAARRRTSADRQAVLIRRAEGVAAPNTGFILTVPSSIASNIIHRAVAGGAVDGGVRHACQVESIGRGGWRIGHMRGVDCTVLGPGARGGATATTQESSHDDEANAGHGWQVYSNLMSSTEKSTSQVVLSVPLAGAMVTCHCNPMTCLASSSFQPEKSARLVVTTVEVLLGTAILA